MKHLLSISLWALLLLGCSTEQSTTQPKQPEPVSDTLKVSGYFVQDTIRIGEKFDFVIEVDKDISELIQFPFLESKDGDIELLDERVDTLKSGTRRHRLSKHYSYIAFGIGDLNIRPQAFYVHKNVVDTLYAADTARLHIRNPFKLDSTSQIISTLKPQADMPFIFDEISTYVMWGLGALVVVLILILCLHLILRRKGRSLKDLFHPAPVLPPHIIAKQALEKLYMRRLWQEGKHKLYYSTLTDILREYIMLRWSVPALEMTSDEIVEAMRKLDFSQKMIMDINDVLREADLVKFAKAMPEAAENENVYTLVWEFVEQTTPEENPTKKE